MPAARAIAVTGGIASGKSEVTQRFEARGIAVLDADLISRELVEPGQPALEEIFRRFGPSVIDATGRLDRRGLREIVFADSAARRDLEAVLHPRVRDELRRRAAAAQGPYLLIAIPLLVESVQKARTRDATDADASHRDAPPHEPASASRRQSASAPAPAGDYAWIDRTLVIDVPAPLQLERVMRRDRVERDAALATIAAQATRDERLAIANDVVVNDGPLESLDAIVAKLHQRYLHPDTFSQSEAR
jgi:dephospho-CoA kinase